MLAIGQVFLDARVVIAVTAKSTQNEIQNDAKLCQCRGCRKTLSLRIGGMGAIGVLGSGVRILAELSLAFGFLRELEG